MASGLQCPGCGHVHPAGLPEIARGDATFRCYGCYRTLSIPEGWSGRPTPRPSMPEISGDAPPGAGMRDARSARLAGRRGGRAGALSGRGPAGPGADAPPDMPTQMVPPVPRDGGAYGASGPTTDWPGTGAGAGEAGDWGMGTRTGEAGDWRMGTRAGEAGDWRTGTRAGDDAGRPGQRPGPGQAGARPGGRTAAAPLGWTVPEPSAAPVPTGIRATVWVGAFVLGLVVAAFVLRKAGLLDVDTVIDLYAGSGPARFGILVVLLPLWALLSATIAHLSLQGLARRRRG